MKTPTQHTKIPSILIGLACALTSLTAKASDVSISSVGSWRSQIVQGKTGEILGNPYALITHPERPRAYFPAIVVYKITNLPAGFDPTSVQQWRNLISRQFPNLNLSGLEGRLFANPQVRYLAETQLIDAGIPQSAAFMGLVADHDVYLFTFEAPQAYFLANILDVRAFMQNTVVNPIQ